MNYYLLIGANGLQAWRPAGGGLECAAAFPAANPEALARFRAWLVDASRRYLPVAELADERHILERLPRIPHADRRLLIDRRLAQHFPDTALTSARPLPAAPEDGLLKPVLLAALARPALIAPWLETLGEVGARGLAEVRALTSAPFLIERWYRRQRALPAQSLLLTLEAGGMRQAFFRRRRLAFSRLIPARGETLADCLAIYRNELTQTLAWLASQGLGDKPPPVRVLAGADDLPLLRDIAPAAGGDIAFIELAPQLGAHTENAAISSISLLALREARHAGALGRYDCPPLRRSRRLANARRIVVAFGMTFAAAGLGAAAIDFAAAERLRDETAQLALRQQGLRAEIGNTNFSRDPSIDKLAARLDAGERLLRAMGIPPASVLQAIADLLTEAPWARLETLAWESPRDGRDTVLLPRLGFAAGNIPSEDDSDSPRQISDSPGNADDSPRKFSDSPRQIPDLPRQISDSPRNVDDSPRQIPDSPEAASSALIALEISLDGDAPTPQSAAATLCARWQRLRGTPMQVRIDADSALLRLHAALPLPEAAASPRRTDVQ
ncbi:MAG: hypothetical protein LBR95_02840 [Azoarcus sp.]|nr:hypothetical protein [Azoarcus sp.]